MQVEGIFSIHVRLNKNPCCKNIKVFEAQDLMMYMLLVNDRIAMELLDDNPFIEVLEMITPMTQRRRI